VQISKNILATTHWPLNSTAATSQLSLYRKIESYQGFLYLVAKVVRISAEAEDVNARKKTEEGEGRCGA